MLRFGAFEFDATTRRLRRDGADVHLPPKAFDLLAMLVEAAPKVVDKRALHARLWRGGVVADATLVALVKQLRRALEDNDRDAPLIRTVNRVGYALEIAPTQRERAPGMAARECWLLVGQRRLSLPLGENVIGRDAAAQVQLNDPVVSRRHARIVVSESGARIADLGSKNGTFLDGARLDAAEVPLPDGARIVFGTLAAHFHESGSSLPTQTHFAAE